MKKLIVSALLLSAFILPSGAVTADNNTPAAKKAQGQQLVALLPASDGVAVIDVKRFFADGMPRLLSGNTAFLAEITGKIDEIQTRTGIDPRQFEYAAVGVSARKLGPKKYDMDPVVILRGQANAAGLIAAGKVAANGKYREERVGDKAIYIFSAKDIAAQSKAAPNVADKVAKELSEVAVTALDSVTLAVGDPARVRQTVEARTKVGTDIIGFLARKEGGIVNFAAKAPEGMSAFLPLDNDELGRNIDAIRYVFGIFDVTADGAAASVTAKTIQNAQAVSLSETLQGLQVLGKALLGSSKAADKQALVRLIDAAKITNAGSEVSVDLRVPQADIDILVSKIK